MRSIPLYGGEAAAASSGGLYLAPSSSSSSQNVKQLSRLSSPRRRGRSGEKKKSCIHNQCCLLGGTRDETFLLHRLTRTRANVSPSRQLHVWRVNTVRFHQNSPLTCEFAQLLITPACLDAKTSTVAQPGRHAEQRQQGLICYANKG